MHRLGACSTRRLSESAKSSRFLADQPIGTDSGRAVHPMRAALGRYPCHRRCRGYCPKALLNRRRAEEQVVPDYGVESDGVVTRSMEGKQAEHVLLSRARNDCPLLTRRTAAAFCFSSLSQHHCSLTNHTASADCIYRARRKVLLSKVRHNIRRRACWQGAEWTCLASISDICRLGARACAEIWIVCFVCHARV